MNGLLDVGLLAGFARCGTTASVGFDEEADEQAGERSEIEKIKPVSKCLTRGINAWYSLPAGQVGGLGNGRARAGARPVWLPEASVPVGDPEAACVVWAPAEPEAESMSRSLTTMH